MRLSATLAAASILFLTAPAAALTLSSGDFANGAVIPEAHIYPRCGGQNVSPALAWGGIPAGTQSLVLTVIDVSVKPSGWSHWIVVDLPPQTSGLARGATLPAPAKAVAGNFGDPFYDGPCPPQGSGVRRYEFTIWAMPSAHTVIAPDARATGVEAMLTKAALAHATIAGHVTR